jgi:hypothetical protein
MRTCKPRRASKYWLFGAPEYVLDCFKCDYTYLVLFGGSLLDPNLLKDRKVHFLELNDMPTNPWYGVSTWGEVEASYRPAHRRVRWLDLPENVRQHIVWRVES